MPLIKAIAFLVYNKGAFCIYPVVLQYLDFPQDKVNTIIIQFHEQTVLLNTVDFGTKSHRGRC